MNDIDKYDFRFGQFNISESEGLRAFLEKSSDKIKKQKTTHSISDFSQVMIKDFAEECAVTQGSIVELAPLFFRSVAEDSINRREKSLGTLHILKKQICNSLSAIEKMSPHLLAYVEFVKEAVEEMCMLEVDAIKSKNFKGVDVSKGNVLSQVDTEKNEIAFHKDVRKVLDNKSELLSLFEFSNKS